MPKRARTKQKQIPAARNQLAAAFLVKVYGAQRADEAP
jgi:hypothetical protein